MKHTVLSKKEDILSKKVAHVVESLAEQQEIPKLHEIDAFRVKALRLLLQEKLLLLPIDEIISLLHSLPIESHLIDGHTLELQSTLTHFPGEGLEIRGHFYRESAASESTLPLKESFKLHLRIYQSGFPHPLQYTGMALPEQLLKPLHFPELQPLLQKKKEIAAHLLPGGKFNIKAKKHLAKKRVLFQNNDDLFFLLKKQIEALAPHPSIDTLFSLLQSHPHRFDAIAKVHADLFQEQEPIGEYAGALHARLKAPIENIYRLQLSEFECTLLTSLFRQALVFIDELHNVPEEASLHLYKEYIIEQIEEEIALFHNLSSTDPHTLQAKELVKSFMRYYQMHECTRM